MQSYQQILKYMLCIYSFIHIHYLYKSLIMSYKDRQNLSQQYIFKKDSICTKYTSVSLKSHEEEELATSLSYQTQSSVNQKKQKESLFQRDDFLNDSQNEYFQNDEIFETLIEIKGQQKKILYKTGDQFQRSFAAAIHDEQLDQNMILPLKIVLVRQIKQYNQNLDSIYEELMLEYLDSEFNAIDKCM